MMMNVDIGKLFNLFNQQAEAAVLAAMRDDPELAVRYAQTMQPEFFYDVRHQVIYSAIKGLLITGDPIDSTTIAAECVHRNGNGNGKIPKVSADYIAALQRCPEQEVKYAASLAKYLWLRRAGETLMWMVQQLQGNPNPDGFFAEAQSRWQTLAPVAENKDFVYGWETNPLHDAWMAKWRAEQEEGIAKIFNWPWASWNRRIRPLRGGNLGLIAAPDGIGKTCALDTIAEHWSRRGHHVVLVHLEDSLQEKLDRRLCRLARIPMETIEEGNFTELQQERVQMARMKMGAWEGRLHYYFAPGKTMAQILGELERRVKEGVCDVVVLDYIDKVSSDKRQVALYGNNTYERQADSMELLKSFLEKHNIPGLSATQGNKAMQELGVTQTRKNISGSIQKSHKAQLIMIFTRELVGPEPMTDARGNVLAEVGEYSPLLNVRCDKQNRGKTGDFLQWFDGKYHTIMDSQGEKI